MPRFVYKEKLQDGGVRTLTDHAELIAFFSHANRKNQVFTIAHSVNVDPSKGVQQYGIQAGTIAATKTMIVDKSGVNAAEIKAFIEAHPNKPRAPSSGAGPRIKQTETGITAAKTYSEEHVDRAFLDLVLKQVGAAHPGKTLAELEELNSAKLKEEVEAMFAKVVKFVRDNHSTGDTFGSNMLVSAICKMRGLKKSEVKIPTEDRMSALDRLVAELKSGRDGEFAKAFTILGVDKETYADAVNFYFVSDVAGNFRLTRIEEDKLVGDPAKKDSGYTKLANPNSQRVYKPNKVSRVMPMTDAEKKASGRARSSSATPKTEEEKKEAARESRINSLEEKKKILADPVMKKLGILPDVLKTMGIAALRKLHVQAKGTK